MRENQRNDYTDRQYRQTMRENQRNDYTDRQRQTESDRESEKRKHTETNKK